MDLLDDDEDDEDEDDDDGSEKQYSQNYSFRLGECWLGSVQNVKVRAAKVHLLT